MLVVVFLACPALGQAQEAVNTVSGLDSLASNSTENAIALTREPLVVRVIGISTVAPAVVIAVPTESFHGPSDPKAEPAAAIAKTKSARRKPRRRETSDGSVGFG